MILAYVRVPYNQIDELKKSIKAIKEKYAFTGEFKWTNVYEANGEMYAEKQLKKKMKNLPYNKQGPPFDDPVTSFNNLVNELVQR